MTLPSSGPLSMNDINVEYGLGTNLDDYRGVRWYLDNAATGVFDTVNIDIAEFYSTRATSPVTPGSQTFTTSGTFTVPTYSVLTVVIKGGSGGGAGGNGNVSNGSPGTAGTASSFGAYGSGDYGRGGQPASVNGTNGAGSDGTPAGGGGGAGAVGGFNGGSGGASGKTTLSLTNPVISGTGPAIGSSVTVTVGGGGSGGTGGAWVVSTPYGPLGGSAGAGGAGSAGSVAISWA